MPLEAGSTLGSYEILAPLDSIAGETYKASDTRLNRIVVLRVLPVPFAEHPELKDGLQRDMQTLASLKHPNICAPIEIAEAAAGAAAAPGTHFLVTEHVEGESLAGRLARGPLEIDEAMKIGIAIADALDKAHRQGVIHRSLTTSAVVLTADGPKLVDFGVARPLDEIAPVGSASFAATRTSLRTSSAIPLTAASYMAPEQFDGVAADARADIFAFGAVLYEMVTGKKAFDGKTLALVIASVQSVESEPASTLQPMTPPALDHVLKRCLSKDPRQRLQTAWDLLGQLQWIAEGGSLIGVPAPVAAKRQKRERAVWAALAVGAVVVAGVAVSAALAYFRSTPDPEVMRFIVTTVGQAAAVPVSISPDGHWIIGSRGNPNRGVDALPLNAVTPQVLIGDSVVTQPFWSPDGRSIAFFGDGKLKKADVAGGPAQTICDTPSPIGGGTWNRDGVILFAAAGAIQRVLAAGGQPTAIAEPDQSKQESDLLAPFFLPDGRHYVFLAVSSQQGDSAVYVGTLDSKERTRLFPSQSKAMYATPGYLLFNRGNTVFAQPFDDRKLALAGEAIRVADSVPLLGGASPNGSPNLAPFANYSVSQTGVLVYRTGAGGTGAPTGPDEQRSLIWVDRNGGRVDQIGTAATYAGVDLAPDGKRFAVHRHEASGGDNWVFDIAQGRMQRLTFDATQDNHAPIWSPDGARIAFASRRSNKWGLYLKPADGTGAEELLTESDTLKTPMSFSPDGKLLVYAQNTGGGSDVWAVPLTGERKPFGILQAPIFENYAQVSPDGKWLAYQSNETGRPEIYVRQFPDGPGKWQVSTDGGNFPRWRRDGKELYFLLAPNIMEVEIRVVGSSLQAGVPQTLFGINNPNATIPTRHDYHRFAVTADGQRFLLSQPGGGGPVVSGGLADSIAALADQGGSIAGAPSSAPQAVTVVLNWPQLTKKK